MKKPRNKFEKAIFDFLKKKRIKFQYESEKIPYVLHGNYIPDFVLSLKDGIRLIEAKGHFRPEAKRKMVAVKQQHPELDLRILFYSHKDKDIRWAERYGFPYAIQEIPKDWLK